MRVRVFTSGPYFSASKGMLDLDVLPRSGDSLLTQDPDGPLFYRVAGVLHVEGSLPILTVDLSEGEAFQGIPLDATGLAQEGALRPLGGYNPFADHQPELDLETPRLGLG